MDSLKVKVKTRFAIALFLLSIYFCHSANAFNQYTLHDSKFSFVDPEFVAFDHVRHKRDVALAAQATASTGPAAPAAPVAPTVPAAPTAPAAAPTPSASLAPQPQAENTTAQTSNVVNGSMTDDANRTTNSTSAPTLASAVVTQIPLLGVNGSGIRQTNITGNTPKVSDPIVPDDNLTDVFKDTPETIKAEHNVKNLTIDNHNFYNSTFIGNKAYFDEYWANITRQQVDAHAVLSNSHRKATTLRLSFDFPFYGHALHNITVATGGFIYTGEHVHNWLAATQYIAPLMANFDTTLTQDSFVKMYDDGEKFTAFWENVTLQEDVSKKFTFAVSLYKNGDIIFAYKDIPIPVQSINDQDHPVKVGISDAYLTDRIVFLVRRKTIYEYHRVSFKNHEVASNTILKLTALPTCLQYDSCETCVNHETGFNCMWCDSIQKCSSGTDRNKQDWMLRHCEKIAISNETSCPARGHVSSGQTDTGNTAYVTTDTLTNPFHEAVVNNMKPLSQPAPSPGVVQSPVAADDARPTRSSLGGVVAALLAITLVCSLVAWTLYAFKNPHTRSGQLLIKYRPSQWSWRRGEARYTAATIHM